MRRLMSLLVVLSLTLGILAPSASAAGRSRSTYDPTEDCACNGTFKSGPKTFDNGPKRGGGGGGGVVAGIDKAKAWWGRITFVRDVVVTIGVATATVVNYGRQAYDATASAVRSAGNSFATAIDNRPVSGTIIAP